MRNSILLGVPILTAISIFIIWDALTFNNDVVDLGEEVDASIIQSYIEEKYGDGFGWVLKDGLQQVGENRFSPYPEYLEMHNRVGVNLKPYRGEYLVTTTFPIKNKCIQSDGEQTFTFIAIQVNNEWVGDYISMDEWIPGMIQTVSKEELFKELKCK